ncbi:MAG: hypothetical protein ACI9LO_001022 [Planctomycetota bacterium]|jgi:hypothetical protein
MNPFMLICSHPLSMSVVIETDFKFIITASEY